MPKIDTSKEAEIKRELRIAIAINPMASSRNLAAHLMRKGYTSSNGSIVDLKYILKLVRKLNAEGKHELEDSKIEARMVETRNRFTAMFDRLFKIAFWNWDFLQEGIMMPEVKDQIKAMEVIMKMDIALIEAEMDAGIFKRNLGTLELDRRNLALKPERKEAIIVALQNWGMIRQNANAQLPTTEPGGSESTS